MRIRLGYLMELIVVLAVGLGLARSVLVDLMLEVKRGRLRLTIDSYGEPTLVGISLAGGVGLLWEVRRRRSPPAWGLGRWTWLLAFLTVVLTVVGETAVSVVVLGRRHGVRFAAGAIWPWVQNSVGGVFAWRAGWAFVALWLTSRLAKAPVDPAPDGREWAGRALLATIIVWTIAMRLYMMLGLR